MHVTYRELRDLKHQLPSGSMSRIAQELSISEQTVRNFFGADKAAGTPGDWHFEPGPDGGIVEFENNPIYEAAQKILQAHAAANN